MEDPNKPPKSVDINTKTNSDKTNETIQNITENITSDNECVNKSKIDETSVDQQSNTSENFNVEEIKEISAKSEENSEKSKLEETESSLKSVNNSNESSKVADTDVDRSQYIHYEGDIAIYTDPQSRQQYTWDKDNSEWKQRQIDYEYDGTNYYYTDDKTGIKYKWDLKLNSWVKNDATPSGDVKLKPIESDEEDEEEYDENDARKTARPIQRQDMSKGTYGHDGDTHTYTDATDGTVYIWDVDKNAWFPKVDEDFLARYQMSYGFIEQPKTEEIPVEVKSEKILEPSEEEKTAQKRKAEPPKWFDVGEESTKVYVSNLPLDIKEDEFVDLMQKCGLIMKDVDNGQMKIKMYTESDTKQFKGDALVTYIKKESVPLALNIIDGYILRDKKIKCERAKFTMKGSSYDPKLKPKKRRKKDLEKMKKIQEKLFDWRPDKLRGERSKNESVIVVKNLFDPTIFDKDVTLILEYQQDLREEASKCGFVKKVTVYDKHPEGVAQIFFKSAEEADTCKELLNKRWFGQRQITAETWDGKSRYKINETVEEKEERLKKWENYLEEEDKKKKEKERKQEEKNDGLNEEKKLEGESEEMIVDTEKKNEDEGRTEEILEDDGNKSDDTRSSGESEPGED